MSVRIGDRLAEFACCWLHVPAGVFADYLRNWPVKMCSNGVAIKSIAGILPVFCSQQLNIWPTGEALSLCHTPVGEAVQR